MQDNSTIPAKRLILIALIQGLVLLWLHQSIELKFWPYNNPQWLFSFYSMAFVGPVLLLLALKTGQEKTIATWTLAFMLFTGLLGYYVGYQATPLSHVRFDALLFAYIASMSIATFKALMYIQQFANGGTFSYSLLFRWSWRNFLTLGLSLLFAACVWGVFMLWASLFKAIKINFFHDLFTERWFFYPALTLANGFGVIIFRNLSNVIDTITRIQQALMKFLLILLVLISMIFMGALPFSGLAPLWDTGGSLLILCMQALMLFFVNAVYQDDPEIRPYPIGLHRFIYIGMVLLPVYSIISFYGLSLRVEQYGWSLMRCWVFLAWFLLALFSFGYLWGISRLRDSWLNHLSKVNVSMGLVVLAAMLIVNSPIMDFRKIVVTDQLKRLNTGKTTIEKFDVKYFRYKLARPGYLALQALKTEFAISNPEVTIRINSLYKDPDNKSSDTSQEEFFKAVHIIGEEIIPEDLSVAIYKAVLADAWRMQNTRNYYLLPLDLNKDGQLDYVLVQETKPFSYINLFYKEDEAWKKTTMNNLAYPKQEDNLIESIKKGNFELVQPKWQQLKIGDYYMQVQ